MPILDVRNWNRPEPGPPRWWYLLTRDQRVSVQARLTRKGLNVSAWPVDPPQGTDTPEDH